MRGRRRGRCVRAAALVLLCLTGAGGASAATGASRATTRASRAVSQPGGPAPVYVFPSPGSQFASPTTQIAFRGIPAAQLGTIKVIGSASGAHTGSVVADPDGNGASFVPEPATPFTPGEVVNVATSLNIEGSGQGSFQFHVATPAGVLPFARRPAARRVNGDVWRFRSRPDLAPAAVTIVKPDPGAHSNIFVAPQIGPFQQGPEIIGPRGGLIWFNPVPTDYAATDFRVQAYRGLPVLTWWQGNETAGVGSGQDIIMSSSYQVVKAVSAANGLSADLHEFQLTPSGSALITAEYPVYVDATAVHGSTQEVVLDSVVQEIDVATGLVLFQWDSLDHVGLRAGFTPLPNLPKKGQPVKPNGLGSPYDYFHVNSVEVDRDGNLLVSGRNTWAVYKVNRQTGATIWTLGGKQSTFRLGPGAAFAFQHDVRARASGDQLLTMFDDGAGPPYVHAQSRALELRLDLKRLTATVVTQRVHSPPLLSSYEGDDQALPDLDAFVGWGQQPYFSQYNSAGKLVFEGRFVDANISYRAYRFHWNGTPATPPAIAADRHGAKMTVYASWNGATKVSWWRVFAGASAGGLRLVATAPKRGFETAIRARARKYVAVQALDAKGHPLGWSSVARVP
jgi:Arylsulfotransferase (ASST)